MDVDEFRKLYGIMERVDERTGALKEGGERMRQTQDDHGREIATLRNEIHALIKDEFAGLNRLIDDRIRAAAASRSMTAREWITIVIGLVALGVSALAYTQRSAP